MLVGPLGLLDFPRPDGPYCFHEGFQKCDGDFPLADPRLHAQRLDQQRLVDVQQFVPNV